VRIGSTSYVYPADIITNVRLLAGTVQDIELVLFEVDDDLNQPPDRKTISELKALAADHCMTYTVHLPLDLRLADEENTRTVENARRVIDATSELAPHGFIVHLESDHTDPVASPNRFVENSVRSLELLAAPAGGYGCLCVENLENVPTEIIDLVLKQAPVSCCIDVGHLWKQRLDACAHVERLLPRARVVHLHGVDGRDHKALSRMPEEEVERVAAILDRGFTGVVTLEVFNPADFRDSVEDFQRALHQVRSTGRTVVRPAVIRQLG
jgi:sugar phosphate isomerase/epimerase